MPIKISRKPELLPIPVADSIAMAVVDSVAYAAYDSLFASLHTIFGPEATITAFDQYMDAKQAFYTP